MLHKRAERRPTKTHSGSDYINGHVCMKIQKCVGAILTVAHPLDKILESLCEFSRLKKQKGGEKNQKQHTRLRNTNPEMSLRILLTHIILQLVQTGRAVITTKNSPNQHVSSVQFRVKFILF